MIWLCMAVTFALSGQTAGSAPQSRPAATSPDTLGERLDEKIAELTLSECPLPAALQRLSEATGVSIVIDDAVFEHLPYGASTKLASLTIRGATLRETLPKILIPLGLAHRVGDTEIRVVRTPALARMDERATWVELKLLGELAQTPYSAEAFQQIRVQYRISAKVDAPAVLAEQMEQAGKGTLAQVLETATSSLGWTWWPNENVVVVLTKQAAIARAMSQKVNGRYIRRHLGEILFALGREAEVHVSLQPGSFKTLPPHVVESYSLFIENMSIRQALDYIAADTGLAYRVEADGIHVGPADDIVKVAAAAGPADDPYVAKLSVPTKGGGAYEFLFRQSELPADVLALRRKVQRDFVQQIRQTGAASQPASASSQPAPPR